MKTLNGEVLFTVISYDYISMQKWWVFLKYLDTINLFVDASDDMRKFKS